LALYLNPFKNELHAYKIIKENSDCLTDEVSEVIDPSASKNRSPHPSKKPLNQMNEIKQIYQQEHVRNLLVKEVGRRLLHRRIEERPL
ncbi:Hypothetical protein FKW44_007467, partial [Caligus rogercresseyi]